MLKKHLSLVIAASICICGRVAASEPEKGVSSPRYNLFPEVGLGFRTGSAVIETPMGRSFDALFALGAELDVAIISSADGAHFLIIPLGYIRPISRVADGSEQIRVETRRQTVDFGVEYDFVWHFFRMGVSAGVSLMVMNAKTTLFDVGDPTLYSGELDDWTDDAYQFPDKTALSTEREIGIRAGPFFNLAFGFDLGRVLGAQKHLLEARLAVQYARRSVRNEIYGWFAFVIRPTAVWMSK